MSERKSGRAVFDAGQTVWEWQTATGVFERHVSEEQMSRLEASDLRLMEPSHEDTGTVYVATPPKRALLVKQHVFVSGANSMAPPAAPEGKMRKLWRRLVPAT